MTEIRARVEQVLRSYRDAAGDWTKEAADAIMEALAGPGPDDLVERMRVVVDPLHLDIEPNESAAGENTAKRILSALSGRLIPEGHVAVPVDGGDVNGRRYKVDSDFHCKVCGIECAIAPKWPERAVCPEHCEDHDYEHDPSERKHLCKHCGQEPPPDWYYD